LHPDQHAGEGIAGTLTFLACPKSFHGHVGVIQRNAITSWTKLVPPPSVMLFGNEPGTREIAAELGLQHVPDIRCDRGVPVLDAVLARAQMSRTSALYCFVNADIVFMEDFAAAVARVSSLKDRFLLVGQRTDLDVIESLRLDTAGWQESLRDEAIRRGRLHGAYGIDYFVFTPRLFDPAPPLLVGRAAIDNWFIYRARRRWAPVIDATPSVLAVHQNHDYSHHPQGHHGVFQGEDAQINWRLAGGHECRFWMTDRTHVLTRDALRVDLSPAQLRRHWDRLPVIVPTALRGPVRGAHATARAAAALLRAVGLRRPAGSVQ
jgi:hypothetical protein